jgi:hypothetical protein
MRSLGLVVVALCLFPACLFPLHEARAAEAARALIRDCPKINAYSDPDDGWLWSAQGCGYGVWCWYGGPDRAMKCSRFRPLEESARALLSCPQGKLTKGEVDRGDPGREQTPWVEAEIAGCGRAVWCGRDEGAERCRQTPDFDTAAAQLAVETGCAAEQMQPATRQVFSRREWVTEKGNPGQLKMQISWRLDACGKPYSCSLLGGLTPVVTCKAALDAPVVSPTLAPPPPPPPASN